MGRTEVPPDRIRAVNDAEVAPAGDYVLYWMIAARRAASSFALDRAVEWAVRLGQPIVVLEALRCDYPHASDRLHRFVIDGMADNARDFDRKGIRYHPYVEPERGAGRGLLAALAERASVVVTDDFPAFFLPRMVAAAGERLPVLLEAVDGHGLLPLAAADRAYPRAYGFRRFLQKHLPERLDTGPRPDPFRGWTPSGEATLSKRVLDRWPAASVRLLDGREGLSSLPLDHSIAPVAARGGSKEARRRWRSFRDDGLDRYHEDGRHPDAEATSGLSPYLHFGHVSAHEIFGEVARHEGWSPGDQASRVTGKAEGWWRMRAGAEAFLEQLVTWRELGAVTCAHDEGYASLESIPDWAKKTLKKHQRDRRPQTYSFEELRDARTADEIWNAAQRQLCEEGVIHNYLRMLWGKKVLEWSPDPGTAAETLLRLNDDYALDGRDPNSYSGIFWTFGRHDRAFGPERAIFGTVRYMSSESTRKKLRLAGYLARFGPPGRVSGRPRAKR